MCEVLEVKRSGYYAWLKRPKSKRAIENEELIKEIQSIHQRSHGRYGSPKITAELRRQGCASRPRVARLMKAEGIGSKTSKKYRQTTDSNHSLKISANRLKRQFEVTELAKVWVSDITYIWTTEGWLYLTVVMDLADRKIIGWALSKGMFVEETTLPAWKMAVKNRPPEDGLIFHSDRGIQYAAKIFRAAIATKNVRQSMSRKGNCWDNAPAESFFKILKAEIGPGIRFTAREKARITIFEFIEIWYNRQRIHSTIGYRTPLEMEQFLTNNLKTKKS